MYYLQSRYYNPEWGRFINADNDGGKVGELLSHNVFAYCMNNPVNMIDPTGNRGFFNWLEQAVLEASVFIYVTTQVFCEGIKDSIVEGISGLFKSTPIVDKVAQAETVNPQISTAASKVYYQSTSKTIAQKLVKSHTPELGGAARQEAGHVFAFNTLPTLKQATQSGARFTETLIKFQTNSSFQRDETVEDCLKNIARVSSRPGPIKIFNVKEVPFK